MGEEPPHPLHKGVNVAGTVVVGVPHRHSTGATRGVAGLRLWASCDGTAYPARR
jgi:hypothetical protein